MKRTYSRPTTDKFQLNITTAMLAGSTSLTVDGSTIKQDLGGAGILGGDDNDGGDDLAKSSLWD